MIASTVVEPESLHLHAVAVRFGGGLELIGFRSIARNGSLDLRTRWRLHHRLNDSLAAVFASDSATATARAALTPGANQTAIGDDLLLSVPLNASNATTLQLQVEDTRSGILLPVCGTSLRAVADFTAVELPLADVPSTALLYSLPWPALRRCRTDLHTNVTLVGYALECAAGLALVRLRWWLRGARQSRLTLRAEVHPAPEATAAPLASASFEFPAGGVQSLEHSFVRRIGSAGGRLPAVSLQSSDHRRVWLPR